MSTLGNRILGTALGAAVGDALGCPFEFQPRSVVTARLGDPPWIDGLYPIEGIDVHPLGVWDAAAPCGIATDDTRMSWLMLHLVAEHGLSVRPKDLAQLYLAVYNRPQDFFPRHELLARDNLAYFVDAACGVLGQPSPAHPQASPEALTSGALGVGMPTLLGMISLPCAGCLQPGNHEEAYRRAFALAFMDVGYGRDVTAVMAAIVALLCSGEPLRESIDLALAVNPYGVDPSWRDRVAGWIKECAEAGSDLSACAYLSTACWGLHPFDPVAALGTALACVVRAQGSFSHALLLAVNQWELARDSTPQRLRDVDCIGSIAGAICGAFAGSANIPADWLASCRAANLEVYGFDIVETAERFCRRIGAR